MYSQDAYRVFVDYAIRIVTAFTSQEAQQKGRKLLIDHQELLNFKANLLQFPREFTQQHTVQTAINQINAITNT